MSFGLEVYDSQGNTRLSNSNMLSRLIAIFYLEEGAEGTYFLEESIDWTKAGIICQTEDDSEPFKITYSGNQIIYENFYSEGHPSGPATIYVFMYR